MPNTIIEILTPYIKTNNCTLKQCHAHVEKEANSKVGFFEVVKALSELNCSIRV
jgi:hypothetical protein